MSGHDLARKFLTLVWAAQPRGGYVFQSFKSGDLWEDEPVPHMSDVPRPKNPRAADCYFSPCAFTGKRRLNEKAKPSRWLYADLDEVDPRDLPERIKPTVAIQTSPGRYQALWLLSKPIEPTKFQRLNQLLTYATGADKGGWHASKVLRVPGTRNHKYRGRPRVRLMWFDPNRTYTGKQILNYIRTEVDEVDALGTPTDSDMPELPNTTAAHLRKRYRKRLGRRARKLLTVRKVVKGDDRSARMWELENLCLDAGMSPEEVLIVVRSTVWNKYKGQRRELRMLWQEIQKAAARRRSTPVDKSSRQSVGARSSAASGNALTEADDTEPDEDDTDSPIGLAPTRLARYLAKDVRPPSWLVEHIWGRAAHGIWAGDFKTYKSTLLMDLAVSVASGRPFLGKFDVHRTGPVLYIQEENSHGFMHDRLHRIVQAKGLGNIVHEHKNGATPTIEFGHDLDLHLLNLSGFDLTKTSHLAGLASWCHQMRPALVILDPLYKLAPGVDENVVSEMTPILSPLSDISTATDCALVLAHHYNKPSQGGANQRAGHRISGTGGFSRWWESSIYAERHGDESAYSIKFHGEHREHGAEAAQVVTVEMSTEDDTYAIHLSDLKSDDTEDEETTDNGLMLDTRTERIAVMTVRSQLGLAHSRDAQQILKRKGYEIRRAKKGNKLWAYPPAR